jgi:hypothetical protein
MSQPTPEQVIQAVYNEAAYMMRNGMTDYRIEQALIEKGIPADAARTVVSRLRSARSEAYRNEAYKQMAIGAVISIIGILVTWGTYSAAANNPGGGSYVVAWGAIIFGGWRFIRGMMMLGEG